MSTTDATDRGIGLTLLFGLLTAIAAAYTLFAGSQAASAVGFAAAMTLATLAVAAIHLYWR